MIFSIEKLLKVRSGKTVAALFVTGIMLTLMQAPYDMWLVAFVCYVPFTFVVLRHEGGKRLYFIACLLQVVFWLFNLHWFGYVTVPGWLAFSIFSGVYWPFIVFVLRWLNRYRVPMTIALPLAIVGAEAWQGIFFNGFDWHLLGHSQYSNLAFIQIADIFGVSGISVLIAMVNGVLCDWVLLVGEDRRRWFVNSVLSVLVVVLVGGNLWYGEVCLERYSECSGQGMPLVASVQSNVMPEIKEEKDQGVEVLESVIEISNQAAVCEPDLIIWPETMVMGAVNLDFVSYPQAVSQRRMHEMVVEHCKGRFPLVVGAHRYSLTSRDGGVYIDKPYNSAYLYHRDGRQDSKVYDKIHLVPFGEYIPYKDSIPGLNKMLKVFTPYDYDYSLGFGEEYTRFEVESGSGDSWGYGVMICYEDTDADVVRKLSYNEVDGKADFIVNISNDGWYIAVDGDEYRPSDELSQRTAITVFRAVENRVSVVRSVNAGISCMIEPSGRIKDGYEYGDLPLKAFEREAVEGWFADRVAICEEVTFFTKYGKWLDKVLASFILIFICFGVIENKFKARIKNVSK